MRLTLILFVSVCLTTGIACSDTEEDPGPEEVPCSVVNGGLVDECPEGSFCHQLDDTDDGEFAFECAQSCTTDEDCDGDMECYDAFDEGRLTCAEAQPVCLPRAAQSDCECGFDAGTQSPVFLVMGTGADCVVVERDQTACYSQTGTCLNSCVDQFFRYDLGDGTALIVRALQGSISDGWTGDGQGFFPESCPVLESEYNAEN
jgi:hypothetical protein